MNLPQSSSSSRSVVTGASSGIGIALATELARRGYSLILVARSAGIMEQLAQRLQENYQVQVDVFPTDLSSPADRAHLLQYLRDQQIDILCNNAGTATFGPVAQLDPEYEHAQVELNAIAVHELTLAVLPGMVRRHSGAILMVGSAAGNMAIPNNATYAATKAFVNTFSESLRGELKKIGVHVTLLAPGPVRTHVPPPEEASIVDRLVPDSFWISADYTAKVSLDALARNKMRVVPGIIGKTMSVLGGYLPRAFVAPIIGSFYKRLGG